MEKTANCEDSNLNVVESLGSEALNIVSQLYSLEGNGIAIRDDDVFFVGRVNNELVGSVRFCIENNVAMLRTMRVAKKFQGLGYGRNLLVSFEAYLVRHKISPVYCLPYSHLEKFYSLIGFKPLEENLVPLFLQTRLQDYRTKGLKVLCMRRDS